MARPATREFASAAHGRAVATREDGIYGSVARLFTVGASDRFSHQICDDNAFICVRKCSVERVFDFVGNDESDSGHCADFNSIVETSNNHTLSKNGPQRGLGWFVSVCALRASRSGFPPSRE